MSASDAISQILLNGANAQGQIRLKLADLAASNRLQSSQIWGNALGNIAQTVAGIPGQIEQSKVHALQLQDMQAQAEDRKAQADQRKYAVEKQKKTDALLTQIGQLTDASTTQNDDGSYTFNRQALGAAFAKAGVPPEMQAQQFKVLDEIDGSMQKYQQVRVDHLADMAHGALQSLNAGADPSTVMQFTVGLGLKNGLFSREEVAPAVEALNAAIEQGQDIRPILQQMRSLSPKYKDADKPVTLGEGQQLVNSGTGAVIANGAPKAPTEASLAMEAAAGNPQASAAMGLLKPPPAPRPETREELARKAAAGDQEAAKALQLLRPPAAAGGAAGGMSADDVNAIADAIVSGDQPPDLKGLYGKTASVKAALAKRGYNQTRALEDWTATQKYLTTLNGQQQTRLRQATSFVKESVPLIRDLVSQWDSAGLPLLSKANLDAAASGAKGQTAQSLARRLKAQIADLQSELGTVYKGGNSSTDESLKLAAENLQADWSKKAALDALDQIETNIGIRLNSMKLAPVANPGNAYDLSGQPNAPKVIRYDSNGNRLP